MSDSDVTQLLNDARAGRAGVVDRLYPLVYDELRRLAQSQLAQERADHTLQATALVHEAYIRLVDQTRVEWNNRSHFFAIAAQAIRRILVDYARRRRRKKRGGDAQHVDLELAVDIRGVGPSGDLLALDQAMDRLREYDEDKVRVVEMRFFGGLTNDEIAEVMDVSTRTIERHWQFARAWLFQQLSEEA